MPDGFNWTSTNATTLRHSGGQIGSFGAEYFRTGGCPGFFASSHYMYAAWSTEAGQRIGAATEVEGGRGPGPAAPPSLTVTQGPVRLGVVLVGRTLNPR